jgi:cysteine desulfurase family protein (TIGR01976 family)
MGGVRAPAVDLSSVREGFPGLARERDRRPCVFADAPGGSQVPASVIDAMSGYLRRSNANLGGAFDTSRESDAVVVEARRAAADLLGCDADEVVFGQNTTSLAFHLSRSIARELGPGDEVVVTRLDHDANIAPWRLAAAESGATLRWVDVREEDCTLDLGSLDAALSERTRLVALTAASNAVGTLTPLAEIARRAHAVGAVVVADAVHFAPHGAIDVRALDVDVLFCSAYKFFGPHVGVMFGRRDLLAAWTPARVRPAPDTVPDRWETGTLSHEALAGLVAAVDYLASLGGSAAEGPARRDLLLAAFGAIREHEAGLSARFLEGLPGGMRLFGVADPGRVHERTPTFALRLGDRHPRQVAEELARRGVFVWDGNYYALELMERLGLEPTGGALRVGFCHYNTQDEVARVLEDLRDLV